MAAQTWLPLYWRISQRDPISLLRSMVVPIPCSLCTFQVANLASVLIWFSSNSILILMQMMPKRGESHSPSSHSALKPEEHSRNGQTRGNLQFCTCSMFSALYSSLDNLVCYALIQLNWFMYMYLSQEETLDFTCKEAKNWWHSGYYWRWSGHSKDTFIETSF